MTNIMSQINVRTKKAIINSVEKLIKKYGYNKTKCVINNLFNQKKEKAKLEQIIIDKEKELSQIKKKLGIK